MNLWTMIVCVVALGIVSEMYRARLKAGNRSKEDRRSLDEIFVRFERFEERLANVESVLLDHEKERRFDQSLDT